MVCNWESLLAILPAWMQGDVNRFGRDELQEIRLRLNAPGELIFREKRQYLREQLSREDLDFCINAASRYSPWAAATAAKGYLTAPGGHRIGICGEMVLKNGETAGIRNISSLCIRVARDFPGIAEDLANISGSILILGAPGWGKTTLLRDLIRWRSSAETVAVVDERGELFPEGFSKGPQTDVLTGCPKASGILQVLKTMGPQSIGVDEITEPEDVKALLHAFGCGVSLLTTAHAGSLGEFKARKVNMPLLREKVFRAIIILHRDQTYQVERMEL